MTRSDKFKPENRITPRFIGDMEVIPRDERREEFQILNNIPISEGISYSQERPAFVKDDGIQKPWYEHVIHAKFTADFKELGALAEVRIEAQPVSDFEPKSRKWGHLSEIQALTSPAEVAGYSVEITWESVAGGTQNHLQAIAIIAEKDVTKIKKIVLDIAEALLKGGKTCEGALTEALGPLGKKVTYRRPGVSLPKK